MSNPFEGVGTITIADIPAYILAYVKATAEPYIESEPLAAEQLLLPFIIDDILFIFEEMDDAEEQLPHLFVLWTNLISAVARLEILVASRKHEQKEGISS